MKIILLVKAFAVGGVICATVAAQTDCPPRTDPCMTDKNYAACLDIINSGCKDLAILESCPLQFACADSSNEPEEPTLKPNACVTLYVYDDQECTGSPKRMMSFPTFTKPGSPCYHDALMPRFSVSDQYCNPDTGNWHEKVYFGSQDCFETKSWWSRWHPRTPVELTFTTDGCIGGLSLKSCSLSPCLSFSNGEESSYVYSAPEHSYSFV